METRVLPPICIAYVGIYYTPPPAVRNDLLQRSEARCECLLVRHLLPEGVVHCLVAIQVGHHQHEVALHDTVEQDRAIE
jgi:hypothetical protein